MELYTSDFTDLLTRAQHGDQEAQMAIVTAFRPLLRKLASQERDYTLRTDLSSQLVLGTLEAIRKFPGTDSRRFPGFLKKHLTFLLSHYKRKQQRWNRLKEKIYALESHETTVTVSLPSCSSLLVIGLVQLISKSPCVIRHKGFSLFPKNSLIRNF